VLIRSSVRGGQFEAPEHACLWRLCASFRAYGMVFFQFLMQKLVSSRSGRLPLLHLQVLARASGGICATVGNDRDEPSRNCGPSVVQAQTHAHEAGGAAGQHSGAGVGSARAGNEDRGSSKLRCGATAGRNGHFSIPAFKETI
jgi:hypothetical protein